MQPAQLAHGGGEGEQSKEDKCPTCIEPPDVAHLTDIQNTAELPRGRCDRPCLTPSGC
jgi:hypothetical protein